MRHTKKNRKQRRNGKNKQRFSKKGGDFGGILRGFVNAKNALNTGFSSAKDAVKSRVSSAASTVADKFSNVKSVFQNTPTGNLNWDLQMRKPNTVTADTINSYGINSDQYNEIQWKTNEVAISKDGLIALHDLAKTFLRNNIENDALIDKYSNDGTILTNLIDNYKPAENTENKNEMENANDAVDFKRKFKEFKIHDKTKDEIKDFFKLILKTGNKSHLIEFSTIFVFLTNFDYEEKFKDGTTPLLVAASNKSPEILNYILTDKEIKDNISFDKDSDDNTVLHIACKNNNPNILKVLFTKVNTQTGGGGSWFSSAKKQDDVFKPIAIDDETSNKIVSLINEKNIAEELPIDIICKKPITEINGEAIKLLVDNGSKFFEANKLLSEKIKMLDNEINALNGEIKSQKVRVSSKTNSLNIDKSQKEVEKQKYQEVIKPITDKINSIKESEKKNIIEIEANKQKALEIALKLTNTKYPPVPSMITAGSPFVLTDFTDGSTILTTPKPTPGIFNTKRNPTQDQLDYFKKESEAQLDLIPDQVIDKILEQYPSQGDKERTIDSNYDNTITAIVETKLVQTNSDLKDTKIEANKPPPPLVQGGRRRVTKRLQHNLRRYKL